MKIGDILLFLKGIEESWGLGVLLDQWHTEHDQIHKVYFPKQRIELLYTEVELTDNTINISKRS